MMSTIRYVRVRGNLQVIFLAYALSLVGCEFMHNVGGLRTDLYLMLCRTFYLPAVWLVENGHCEWLAELLKMAATP